MKRFLGVAAGAFTLAVSSLAFPCGGMFGPNVEVDASQTLLVSHKQGTEDYVFSPHFCGEATQFGLILPIPAVLSKNPTLGSAELFEELAKISAPAEQKVKQCKNAPPDAGGGALSGSDSNRGDVNVVDRGQVGIFDWSLVKADSIGSFTDWLDANGFPHEKSADAQFAHYVAEGFYFVAFKVTAGPDAPPAGKKLCGNFGPIELAFPAQTPIVPTRIAAVSAEPSHSPQWRIYGVSAAGAQLGVASKNYGTLLSYADAVDASTLAGAPHLASFASVGDRLTRLEVGFAFNGLDGDLTLTSNAPQSYRATVSVPELVDCPDGKTPVGTIGDSVSSTDPGFGSRAPQRSSAGGGCGMATGNPSDFALVGLVASIATALVRRRRR